MSSVSEIEATGIAGVVINRMTVEDLPQVMAIENVSFPMPFTENLFRMELNLNVAHLYVARGKRVSGGGEDAVLGYIDYWLVEKEIHVITIAAHPSFRRCRIGTALMDSMLKEAREKSVTLVTLDVRPSNEAAIRLYRKFGFEETGVRWHYYQDNGENALVMSLKL